MFTPSHFPSGSTAQQQQPSEQTVSPIYQHRPFSQHRQDVSRSPVVARVDVGEVTSGSSSQTLEAGISRIQQPAERTVRTTNATDGQGHASSITSALGPSSYSSHPGPSSVIASADRPSHDTPPSKKARGRPRKWAREEDRRAAEAQRRRDKTRSERLGIPLPPRPEGTYVPPPQVEGTEDPAVPSQRSPYIYFDKDYGHHVPGAPGALSARDVLVDWLAEEGNWTRWARWTGLEREEACRGLRSVMQGHGMTEREVLSIKQQISFIQRSTREARKFDVEGTVRDLTPSEQRKIAPLVSVGLTPHQALLKIRWPYYDKLKSVVADEPLSATGDGTPDHPPPHEQDDLGQVDTIMDLDTIHRSPSTAALAGTTLGQALRSVEAWPPGVQEPSEEEIADVAARANRLLATDSAVHAVTAHPARPSVPAIPFAPAPPPPPKAMTKREAEAWELEKLQIRQRLELEREDRREKARVSARELHLESIKAFRDLLRDGLTKGEAGRLVWQEGWPAMRRQMAEDE